MPVANRRPRPYLVLLIAFAFAAATVGWWFSQGRQVVIGESAGDRVQCMSYAPFRKPGESPFVVGTVVSEARLREDLTLLSARTGCIRTYSVQQGLDAIPRIAQSLGMKVLLGVWLGRNRLENEAEMTKAIALARQFPGTVDAMVVGNEVLLRRELAEPVLAAYLDRARAESGVPVTYADVWEFWSEHRSLASHVNFVTIHILPYWEDHPVGIDAAIDHIVQTAEAMRTLFVGKEILIGETGWPSAGRARRAAVASRINQATFFRQFSVAARDHGFRYNFIESFDQPWKRRMEGAMGGNWGLFDSDGLVKFPARGPVEEDPRWQRGLIGAVVGALVFIVLAWRWQVRGIALVIAAVTGVATGAVAVAQWRYLFVWNRYPEEWASTLAFSALSLLFPLVAISLIGTVLRPGLRRQAAAWEVAGLTAAAPALPSVAAVFGQWRSAGGGFAGLGRLAAIDWLGVLRFLILFGTAVMTSLLVFDSRYRGFPVALYACPLLALLLVMAAGVRTNRFGIEEAVLATITVVGAIAVVPMERLSNGQALVFSVQMVLLSGAATGFRYWRPVGAGFGGRDAGDGGSASGLSRTPDQSADRAGA